MTAELVVHFVPDCDPARFARLGAGLLARLDEGGSPRLVLAALTGDAVLLGRFQRAATTIDLSRAREQGLAVHRRLGGGRAIRAGDGILGVLFGVPDLGCLLPKPVGPDKVLNRYVRGLCAGITATGAAAHYFGRDFVSADHRQIAILSQDGSSRGAAVLESLVGVRRSLELPPGIARFRPHNDPRSGGPAQVALSDLLERPVDLEPLARTIASGYAKIYKCELVDEALSFAEAAAPEPPVVEDESSLLAGGPREVPIGFVEALVRHDGERIEQARLRGDFIARGFTMAALEASLVGCPLDARQIGLRVDAAFRAPGATIVGVTSLRVFSDALWAAIESA